MRVLMFGWEFPPLSSGGLGTACYGLTKALSQNGVSISLVLPRAMKAPQEFVKIIPSNQTSVSITHVNSVLSGYLTSHDYETRLHSMTDDGSEHMYGNNLFAEIHRYAAKAAAIALQEPHDIIHAHDWMTFQAGLEAKRVSGKPLVVHVHSTEFDRTGGHGINPEVYAREKDGMEKADMVIAVSNFTKRKIVEHYGIPADKVKVVHNAIDTAFSILPGQRANTGKVVLFLGRVTLQKGPEYFLYAAKKVLERMPDVTFVMAGTGDMEHRMIALAARLGIADRVLFSGFLQGEAINHAYRRADLFVMPSVSEPFGLVPLEAIRNGTPALISRQSGVSEVLSHCLKVDFWDIDQMADKILAVLSHPQLQRELQRNGMSEVAAMSWNKPAQQCIALYHEVQPYG